MTLSRQTFNQVRNILRELDSRITSVREQRTGEPDDARRRADASAPAQAKSSAAPIGSAPGRQSA